MDAIRRLMEEHQLILGALDALERFADEVEAGRDDWAELARFVTFIKEFADLRHHGKEEDVLFEAMVRAGFPRGAGPIGVMLAEHGMGREQVAVLAEEAGKIGPWDGEDRRAVVEAARAYAELLRAHIQKEDSILYPMARARLAPAVLARIDADCAALDERQAAAGERLLRLGGELVARHAA
jgi:hemerythrin-like domain-containing protein